MAIDSPKTPTSTAGRGLRRFQFFDFAPLDVGHRKSRTAFERPGDKVIEIVRFCHGRSGLGAAAAAFADIENIVRRQG